MPGDSWEDDDDDDWENTDLSLPGAGKADAEKEEWSDEEGHDAHKQPDPIQVAAAAPAPPPAPPKPKTGLAKKIEEREAREREEAERRETLRKQMQGGDDEVDVTEGMDEATAERLRRKKLEEAADLDNAIDAFGLAEAPSKREAAAVPSAGGEFEAFAPKSDADFEKLAEMMQKKLSAYEGTKGHMTCVKSLLKLVTKEMSVDETKDLTATLSVIQNAKLAAERDKDKQKKKINKSKGKFSAAASRARENDMDDIGTMGAGSGWSGGGGGRDDDYDFM